MVIYITKLKENKKIFMIMISIIILGILAEKLNGRILLNSKWNDLCIAIWSGQLVFSFFSATLFTFIIDRGRKNIYGIPTNEIVGYIYTNLTLSSIDLLTLSLCLAVVNLFFLIYGNINAMIIVFIVNVIFMFMELEITIDYMMKSPKIKKALSKYIKDNLINKEYFEEFIICCSESFNNDEIQFKENLSFLGGYLLKECKDKEKLDYVYKINESLYRIENNIINKRNFTVQDVEYVFSISAKILFSSKIKIEKSKYIKLYFDNLKLIIKLSDDFNDKDIIKILQEYHSTQLIDQSMSREFLNDISDNLSNNIEVLFKNNKIEAANNLIDKFINLHKKNKDLCKNQYFQYDFLDSFINSTRQNQYNYIIVDKLFDIYNFVCTKNVQTFNQEHNDKTKINCYNYDFGIKIYQYYFLIINNEKISYKDKINLLKSFEQELFKKYFEGNSDSIICEMVLLCIIKKFCESSNERLLILLDKLVNVQYLSKDKLLKQNNLIAKLSYYFYYVISCEEVFNKKQRDHLKDCISKSNFPSHRTFLSCINTGEINIWDCYTRGYYDPVFIIDMEFIDDKIERNAYAPYLINNWIYYFVLFSSFMTSEYKFHLHNVLFDWDKLRKKEILITIECFDKYGSLSSNMKQRQEDFEKIYGVKENKSKLLYNQIHKEYKKRIFEQVNKYYNLTKKNNIVSELISKLKEKIFELKLPNNKELISDTRKLYFVQSTGVLCGEVSNMGDDAEKFFLYNIKKKKIKFSSFNIKIEKVKYNDDGVCMINKRQNSNDKEWFVNVVNDVYLCMNSKEMEEYINKYYVKIVVTLE